MSQMYSLDELMRRRAEAVEIEIKAKIDKDDATRDIKHYLIEEQMLDFLNINMEALNRMTRTEPDRQIKRRVYERSSND